MPRHFTAIAAVMLALLLLPALGAADDKDKDKKDPAPDAKKDDPAPNTEKTIKAGTITGKVAAVNGTGKTITLEIVYEYSRPNLGEMQALEQARVNLARAIASRNPGDAANAERDIALHSLRLTQVERKTKNKEFPSTDDAKVRLTEPPPAYDDKGNIKKRTEKELKELKGDSKLPGYPGDWNDLRQGDMVRLTLIKKKEVHHTDPKAKDADPDPLGDDAPQASLIEILSAPPEKK